MKVTKALRRTWAEQREQMLEEREHTQSGARRGPAGVAEVDAEIKVMDALLALPLGTRFDAQDIRRGIA